MCLLDLSFFSLSVYGCYFLPTGRVDLPVFTFGLPSIFLSLIWTWDHQPSESLCTVSECKNVFSFYLTSGVWYGTRHFTTDSMG